jgi:hypothetical protein
LEAIIKEKTMGRLKITRNVNREQKQLLQAKLDSSLVADVNLLCKWSGNEKNYVIAELLRYALAQEPEFQKYKHSLPKGAAEPIQLAAPDRREPVSERKLQPAAATK